MGYSLRDPLTQTKRLDGRNIALSDHLAQIDQRIAHTPEGCADAYLGAFSDLLKGYILVDPHLENLSLCFG